MKSKSEQRIQNLPSETSVLKNLRDLVRKWYGAISIDELMKNSALVKEIEKIELLLSQMAVAQ